MKKIVLFIAAAFTLLASYGNLNKSTILMSSNHEKVGSSVEQKNTSVNKLGEVSTNDYGLNIYAKKKSKKSNSGSRRGKCSKCGGSGYVKCTSCGGYGQFWESSPGNTFWGQAIGCKKCGGGGSKYVNGATDEEGSDNGFRKGAGRMKCPKCKGKRK